MIEIVLIAMLLWIIALTVAVFMLNKLINNHEYLLYILRDEINKTKRETGHIFCKTADNDFDCRATKGAFNDD